MITNDIKNTINSIIIVGGGSSGWMSACYLKRSFPSINVTVIEAPSVPRIGVGEATIPNLQSVFWDHLGIPEEQWMTRVNASFKMGVKFINWAKNPRFEQCDYYYHLFGVMPNCFGIPLSHYWNFRKLYLGIEERLDYTCYSEPVLADAMVSPRFLNGQRVTYYAWHFDVNLMVEYLKELAMNWGVSLVSEEVESGEKNIDGYLTSVTTSENNKFLGDLFIDCTGFRGVLIEKLMNEEFLDMNRYLLCNSAVATQLKSDGKKDGVAPYTTATALSSGWCWDIPLVGRKGTGYVYSDDFISTERAIEELSGKLKIDPENCQWNEIRFRVGRRRNSWVKNCVAIGLTSNFLEPLESTALYLTYGALYQLVKYFPDREFDDRVIKQFNNEVAVSYDDCLAFIQMHYATTKRDDTDFWRTNQFDLMLSSNFLDIIDRYKSGLPINAVQVNGAEYYRDFELEYRNFWTNGSYYAILTGMGVCPDSVYPKVIYNDNGRKEADEMILSLRGRGKNLAEKLPSNYQFLDLFHSREGSRIKFSE